jgi:hypothetical protein
MPYTEEQATAMASTYDADKSAFVSAYCTGASGSTGWFTYDSGDGSLTLEIALPAEVNLNDYAPSKRAAISAAYSSMSSAHATLVSDFSTINWSSMMSEEDLASYYYGISDWNDAYTEYSSADTDCTAITSYVARQFSTDVGAFNTAYAAWLALIGPPGG